jgi:hypothetical protein
MLTFSPLPRRHWIYLSPQTTPSLLSFYLSVSIQLPVLIALLTLIFLVMPRQAGRDLRQIHIVTIKQHLTHQAFISVSLAVYDSDMFAYTAAQRRRLRSGYS